MLQYDAGIKRCAVFIKEANVPTSPLPEWVLYIQALGPTAVSLATTFVAIAVGFIAWQQWRTARAKVALDLFDKRFALYQELVNLAVDGREFDELKWVMKETDLVARTAFLFGRSTSKQAAAFIGCARTLDHDKNEETFPKLIAEMYPLLELSSKHTCL